VPLVARDLPVLREVFGGAARFGADAHGLAVELCHAIEQLDPVRRRAGEALAASHTWHAAAHKHLELYRAVAAARA
jgi:hypothetical protein